MGVPGRLGYLYTQYPFDWLSVSLNVCVGGRVWPCRCCFVRDFTNPPPPLSRAVKNRNDHVPERTGSTPIAAHGAARCSAQMAFLAHGNASGFWLEFANAMWRRWVENVLIADAHGVPFRPSPAFRPVSSVDRLSEVGGIRCGFAAKCTTKYTLQRKTNRSSAFPPLSHH